MTVKTMYEYSFGLSRCSAAIVFLVWLIVSRGALAQSDSALGVEHADTVVDVETLLMQAEQGDARASFLLGTRYASGRAGYQDDSEAVRWFTRAAQAGLAEAQYNLGIMYASGRGVAVDMERAAHWYEAAAEQGVVSAQYNVGTLYGVGLGVEKDYRQAAKWLRAAAEQGLTQAEYNLATLYEHGRGVRMDAGVAIEWYERAASKGYRPAIERLANLRQVMAEPASPVPAATSPTLGGVEPEPTAADVELAQATSTTAQKPVLAATPVDLPAPATVVLPKTSKDSLNGWMRAQDPALYTIQLVSHSEERLAGDFIQSRGIGSKAGYVASTSGGKTYYSVLYGVYETHEQASLAARKLPATLHGIEPWVRNVGQVQQKLAD